MLIAEFGGACQKCGYNRSPRALHFHHNDASEKYEWGANGKAALREISAHPERFILLCANCHAEEHDRLENERAKHFNKCAQCGTMFPVIASRVHDPTRGKLCSHACAYLWQRTLSIASLRERLMRQTRAEGECLVWTGWICRATKTPIVHMPVEGKRQWANRSARRAWYELEHGPVAKNKQLTQGCATPYCIAHTRLKVAA